MKIKILASSSTGNCYVIQGITESIMIEAGIPFAEIKSKLDWNMSDISCCLLSHDHADHSKSIKDIFTLGKRVYASTGTFEALNLKNHFANHIKEGSVITTKEFTIKPFNTEHDCPEPLGFLIYSRFEYKTIVFATDTYYLKYLFADVDAFLLEVNFIEANLQEAVDSGEIPEAGALRLRKSHMSLDRAIKFFDAMKEGNRLRATRHIIPIHTSKRFGDPEVIKAVLEERFSIPVHINESIIII